MDYADWVPLPDLHWWPSSNLVVSSFLVNPSTIFLSAFPWRFGTVFQVLDGLWVAVPFPDAAGLRFCSPEFCGHSLSLVMVFSTSVSFAFSAWSSPIHIPFHRHVILVSRFTLMGRL
ncbi:unnamed protein product [Linum trigynum]|uniref:Uncharacterized protein n=1 Tax=Linum trigynum TaxID=586398 RepID=A0AAV2DWK9_9ROSI